MSLKRRETSETAFIEILKSKHARYVDGGVVVARNAVEEDYLPPGAVLGEIATGDGAGKYGPVTRAAIAEDSFDGLGTVVKTDRVFNFQVGDTVNIKKTEQTDIQGRAITAIDATAKTITVDGANIAADYNSGVIEKDDGTSVAKLVCTHGMEFDNDEDKFVGGIVHGAVHKGRLPNYDAQVAADLPLVSFE